MIYICCGMHRSASTWQYRVLKEVLKIGIKFIDAGWIPRHRHFIRKKFPKGDIVLKTHSYDEDFCKLINKGKALGLHSVRDPRDIVVSLVQMKGMSYDEALSILNNDIIFSSRWSSCKNMIIMRYEDIISDHHQNINIISKKTGINLSHDDVCDINNECGINKAKDISQKLEEKGLDVEYQDGDTLLHPKHISDGKIGKWKNILPSRVLKIIEKKHAKWMKKFNYARGDSCA